MTGFINRVTRCMQTLLSERTAAQESWQRMKWAIIQAHGFFLHLDSLCSTGRLSVAVLSPSPDNLASRRRSAGFPSFRVCSALGFRSWGVLPRATGAPGPIEPV